MKHFLYITFVFLVSCSTSVDNEEINSDSNYHRDLNQTTPFDFLLSLKKEPGSMSLKNGVLYDRDQFNFIMCNQVDSNWFRKSDISLFLPYLDSNYVIAKPVFSAIASITTENHGYSTMANEAYQLMLGYRYGKYPPYSTIALGGNRFDTFRLADSSKAEIISWWNSKK